MFNFLEISTFSFTHDHEVPISLSFLMLKEHQLYKDIVIYKSVMLVGMGDYL